MLRKHRISTYLLLFLLGCFFLLSVAAPKAWRDVAREKTAEELLADVDATIPKHVAVSVPSAPKLELTAKPAGDWTVTDASSKLAARPIAPSTDSPPSDYQPWESAPLSLELVLNSKELPLLALIPAPSKPPLELPVDVPLELPADLPDLSRPHNEVSESAKHRQQQTEEPTAKPAEAPAEEAAEIILQPDWPMPLALFAQLDKLSENAATEPWAVETRRLVEALGRVLSLQGRALSLQSGRSEDEVSSTFTRLRTLNDQTDGASEQMEDDCLAEQLRRTSYSLRRRLDLWQLIAGIDTKHTAGNETYLHADRLATVLTKVESLIGNSAQSGAWREFLLIDALRSLADKNNPAGEDDGEADWTSRTLRRMLVGEVLARVARHELSEPQQQFLVRDPFVQLGSELRRITDDTFDRRELLRRLEEYEAHNLPGEGRWLADESLRLAVSPSAGKKALGRQLTRHYCNPNLRIALSEDLLNRLMPPQPAELSHVREWVLGNPVRGRSLTETDVAIRLIPDPHRLLLALEISGDVTSLTKSSSGPATFRSQSTSRYVARKPMEITISGIVLWPAEVSEVSNATRLRSLQTDFDGIPLIGYIVQNMARSSHDSKRREVEREINCKVAARARRRIDSEADARLKETSQRLKNRVLQPLENLSIVPQMIAAETNDRRMVMQLRLASDKQLAAHTQRPWAPLDSLLSVQIHQTAVNNVLAGLNLDDDTLTLKELKCRVAAKFNAVALLDDKTKHDDVEITFAPRDALRIDCRDGRIAVTLSIARLEKSPRVWKNFQVRAYYRVEVDGLSAKLVRDGSIRMVGRRISTGAQLAIRSIFARVFSKNASRQLLPERIRGNPNMADQVVTQFDIDDGWVAVAMGPRR